MLNRSVVRVEYLEDNRIKLNEKIAEMRRNHEREISMVWERVAGLQKNL